MVKVRILGNYEKRKETTFTMDVHASVYNVLFKRQPYVTSLRIRKDGGFYLGTSVVSGEIISLNSLAGEICVSCDGTKKVGEIYEKLVATYPDTCKHTIAYDLCKCLSDLERLGMVSFNPPWMAKSPQSVV